MHNMSLVQLFKDDIKQLKGTSQNSSALFLFFSKKNFRVVILYRLLNYYKYNNKIIYYFLAPVNLYYRLMTNRYCIDLAISTKIGGGFKLNHAYGIVINQRCIIGNNAYIGHNVTIGSNTPEKYPIIGNNVTVFTGSVIIGDIMIGNNVIIGAGSLVIKNIPDNTIVGGHPCKVLKTTEDNFIED